MGRRRPAAASAAAEESPEETIVAPLRDRRRPLVFGEVLFDVFDDERSVLGGAPFNVAWHLRGFGLDPLFLGRVGSDPRGEEIRERMADWNLDEDGLQDDLTHATGEVRAKVIDGAPRYEILEDRAWDFVDADRAGATARMHDHSFLYHGSLALRSPRTREAFARVRSAVDAPVFCDVNLRPPHTPIDRVRSVLDGATIAKTNDEELGLLTERSTDDVDALVAAARVLAGRHDLRRVVVTRGPHGAFDVEGDDVVHVDAVEAPEIVDTVGAGDAFASVLLLGLVHGWPRATTLQRAARFAAAVCAMPGAANDSPELYSSQRSTWEDDDA